MNESDTINNYDYYLTTTRPKLETRMYPRLSALQSTDRYNVTNV
jgi:hypothetical protein